MENKEPSKYYDAMRDYPPPATHNIVFVSNTVPRSMVGSTTSFWNGKTDPSTGIKITFIGEVFSLWGMFTPESLNDKLESVMEQHKITIEDIIVREL